MHINIFNSSSSPFFQKISSALQKSFRGKPINLAVAIISVISLIYLIKSRAYAWKNPVRLLKEPKKERKIRETYLNPEKNHVFAVTKQPLLKLDIPIVDQPELFTPQEYLKEGQKFMQGERQITIGKGKLYLKEGLVYGIGTLTQTQVKTLENKFKEAICIGKFEKGQLIGQGKMTFPNGDVYKGIFKDNQLCGDGAILYSCGVVMRGSFLNNQLNGEGFIKYVDGTVYEGTFKDGCLNGPGKITSIVDKETLEGEFRNNKLNGKGKIITKNGHISAGLFINGLLEGEEKKSD